MRACARFLVPASLFIGCGGGDIETEVEEASPRLIYSNSKGLTPCAGTFRYMEGYTSFLTEVTGFEERADVQLKYRWLSDRDYDDVNFPKGYIGYSVGRRATSRDPVCLHEIGHPVVRAYGLGGGAVFFEEGFVQAYSMATAGAGKFRYNVGTDAYLEDADMHSLVFTKQGFDYAVAGSFVAFLITRHGVPKYLALLDRLGAGLGEAGATWVFDEIYGASLQSHFDEFLSSSRSDMCDSAAGNIAVYDCTVGPELRVDSFPAVFEWTPQCGDERSVGGVGDGEPDLFTVHRFSLAEDGVYDLELVAPSGDARAAIGRCDTCSFAASDIVLREDSPYASESLEKGSYFIKVWAGSEGDEPVGVRILAHDPLGG